MRNYEITFPLKHGVMQVLENAFEKKVPPIINHFCIITMLVVNVNEQCVLFLRDGCFMQPDVLFVCGRPPGDANRTFCIIRKYALYYGF